MSKKLNLGFLASGRGSNVESIIRGCLESRIAAIPTVIISNKKLAPVLELGAMHGIPTYHRSSKTHGDGFDESLIALFTSYKVDLIILAGYLQPIGPGLIQVFSNRIINIHPSLLPKYGGIGMYGIHVHEAVVHAKEEVTGVTIHLVDQGYDTGKILAQKVVPVFYDDSPETLAKRVLAVEHILYPEVISKIASGALRL